MLIKGPEVIALSLDAPEILTTAEPLQATVRVPSGTRTGLHATLQPTDAADARRDTTRVLRLLDGEAHVSFDGLAPGGYTLTVAGTNPGSAVAPVTATTVVWDPMTGHPRLGGVRCRVRFVGCLWALGWGRTPAMVNCRVQWVT